MDGVFMKPLSVPWIKDCRHHPVRLREGRVDQGMKEAKKEGRSKDGQLGREGEDSRTEGIRDGKGVGGWGMRETRPLARREGQSAGRVWGPAEPGTCSINTHTLWGLF